MVSHKKLHSSPNSPVRFIFLVFLFIVAFLIWNLRNNSFAIVSPIPGFPSEGSPLQFFFAKKKDPLNLKRAIQKIAETTLKNYSVVVIDYKSDFSFAFNNSVIYTAASVNKVPILAALYYFAQKGEIDLDETITVQARDIINYGTGVIRNDAPGATYSIKTLARLLIQKSDNTAAYILGNHVVGIAKIQTLMESWGLSQTDIANNKTSNKDMAILFKKIYSGNVANRALTEEMLAFLKDTDFENRLPANLPKGTVVYHKIGTEVRVVHDAGIIVSPKSTYYLGVFTGDVVNEQEASAIIAALSEAVYTFMQ